MQPLCVVDAAVLGVEAREQRLRHGAPVVLDAAWPGRRRGAVAAVEAEAVLAGREEEGQPEGLEVEHRAARRRGSSSGRGCRGRRQQQHACARGGVNARKRTHYVQ